MTPNSPRGSGAVPSPALTVAAVARRLGVAPATLRTWDRRYGVGPGQRVPGSHRRYGPVDVGRLTAMSSLIMQGVPPAEAARIALSLAVSAGGESPPGPGASAPGTVKAPGPGPTAPGGRPAPTELRARQGIRLPLVGWTHGRSVAPGRPLALGRPQAPGRRTAPVASGVALRGLLAAAASLNTAEMTRVLSAAVEAQGVVSAWDTLALPVLTAVGRRWQDTGVGIDVEHAFTETLLDVLRGVPGNRGLPRPSAPVLLSCVEGDHHTLPLHALAAALTEHQVDCRMLGTGLPARDLVAAARRIGPGAVFLYANLPVTDRTVLAGLRNQRPAPRVLVGGNGWVGADLPEAVTRADSLAGAVAQVRAVVQA